MVCDQLNAAQYGILRHNKEQDAVFLRPRCCHESGVADEIDPVEPRYPSGGPWSD